MDGVIIRDLGEQPLIGVMADCGLSVHDVVAGSSEQITHKMVSRGRKGRRLSRHVQMKILRAVNNASGKEYSLSDLFNY
ncbi:MAG: hypothetical protein ACYS8Z_09025 [Planctomycetota bacterium]|jgi:hypothetical protein